MKIDNSTLLGLMGVFAGGAQSILQADRQADEANFTKQALDVNAGFATLQAEHAIKAGESKADALATTVNQLIGRQRASAVALGVNPNSGSALALQQEAGVLGSRDQQTIRNDAWRVAHGYEAEAASLTAQGQAVDALGRARVGNTLLTGGIRAASQIADINWDKMFAPKVQAKPDPVPQTPLIRSDYVRPSARA